MLTLEIFNVTLLIVARLVIRSFDTKLIRESFNLIFLDIDECLTNPCHVNASCMDNEGSFVCQCHAGYSGNGFNCSGK